MDLPLTATTDHETELKLTLDPADLHAFKALRCLAKFPRSQTHLSARYFDTDDHALRRAGYSLRLRSDERGTMQTLKGPAETAGMLLVRAETDIPVNGAMPNIEALRPALPPDLHTKISGRLLMGFAVEFDRTEWVVRRVEGLVSVSVDDGWIEAGDKRQRIVEAELELRDGRIEAVLGLAREAADDVALHVSRLSKAERGYRLLGIAPETNAPGEFRPGADRPAMDAFRAIAGSLLREIAAERVVVLESGAAEPVHRLRVTLRRLASLLQFVDQTLPGTGAGSAARAARRAFRRLGAVRDLDILAAALPLNTTAADAALAGIATEREAALVRARTLLASRSFAAGMLDLLIFAGTASVAPRAAPTLGAASARILGRGWRRLRRSGPPGRMKRKRRHRFRIHAKTLRYATEFFGDVFSAGRAPERRQRMESLLRSLQDALGRLNDQANIRRLLRRHLGSDAVAMLGLASGDPGPTEDSRIADHAYRRLVKRKRFWR